LQDDGGLEGAGTGLATVWPIVHRHGGKIPAEAEVDKGVLFQARIGRRRVHSPRNKARDSSGDRNTFSLAQGCIIRGTLDDGNGAAQTVEVCSVNCEGMTLVKTGLQLYQSACKHPFDLVTRVACGAALFSFALLCLAQQPAAEAPSGYDNQTNGLVDQKTHLVDEEAFDRILGIADGLGPLYSGQSCRECHQNPISGGASQVSALRVGHLDAQGHFQNPEIPIAHGQQTVKGRSLINDRAICPNSQSPNIEIQERVPDTENVRTLHLSLNILGDGYVEAVPDATLLAISKEQCSKDGGRICGQALHVPVVEAPGQTAIGRFGWKDQQASLLSFAGDAYINEMGITNKLFTKEVAYLCNTIREPNEGPNAEGMENLDFIARFLRATEAPARDAELAATAGAQHGAELFSKIGCDRCHVSSLTTAPAGTKINGGQLTVPDALGSKTIHPYGDYLLHNVGTGDGIVIFGSETAGPPNPAAAAAATPPADLAMTQNKVRTAPLWGVRLRPRLMHDGDSLTLNDAILRHKGEATQVTAAFQKLSPADQQSLLDFLKSL
jgi:Di-haem oxidoreductase, putative peroxidase